VRVFSATHRDLAESIRLGRFREDLYYRLDVLPVEVPSLRERLEDIRLLVQFFIEQACPEDKRISVSPDVFAFLKSHRWPGNIRELRNLVYRALAFCDGPILKKDHISPFLRPSPTQASTESETGAPLDLSPIKRKEREVIIDILRNCRGNQSEAAKHLGIGRTTLYYKIKEYAIDMRRIGLVG
jgi:DNA-binding NtrC family response regulator